MARCGAVTPARKYCEGSVSELLVIRAHHCSGFGLWYTLLVHHELQFREVASLATRRGRREIELRMCRTIGRDRALLDRAVAEDGTSPQIDRVTWRKRAPVLMGARCARPRCARGDAGSNRDDREISSHGHPV